MFRAALIASVILVLIALAGHDNRCWAYRVDHGENNVIGALCEFGARIGR